MIDRATQTPSAPSYPVTRRLLERPISDVSNNDDVDDDDDDDDDDADATLMPPPALPYQRRPTHQVPVSPENRCNHTPNGSM